MKGIVLAGGSGSRLQPATREVSKQLLPVFDKPMIYYPLSVLMLASIREILIITTAEQRSGFESLLGDGGDLGLSLTYQHQDHPRGLPDAFVVGADFLGDDSVMMVLGDNIFYGTGFGPLVQRNSADFDGCVVFGHPVDDPHRHGIGEADDTGRLVSVEEKPRRPRSNRALTGLYIFDNRIVSIASELRPSGRGETEITDCMKPYMADDTARLVDLGRGFSWLDTGTPDALLEAQQFVRTIQHQLGFKIACLEEIAMRMGFISPEQGLALARSGPDAHSEYVSYVAAVAEDLQLSGSHR